jgi:uncharacterized protein
VAGKTYVVYHRADFDGLLSGAVCSHFMPDAELIGWDFGDVPVSWDSQPDDKVYVVDLPPTAVTNPFSQNMVWIDHHKSSIDAYDSEAFVQSRLQALRDAGADEDELIAVRHRQRIPGLRIDGVAACRLCWQYLRAQADPSYIGTAEGLDKQQYIDRKVKEPLVLTLAGEYDVWDLRDERSLSLQFGMTARGWTSPTDFLGILVDKKGDYLLAQVEEEGEAARDWQLFFAASVLASHGYVREFEGLRFVVLASAHARNSMWFPGGWLPDGIDALMAWRYDGKRVGFSLYHHPNRNDLDLSVIAAKYGGGGHRGACGFSMTLDAALEVIR